MFRKAARVPKTMFVVASTESPDEDADFRFRGYTVEVGIGDDTILEGR